MKFILLLAALFGVFLFLSGAEKPSLGSSGELRIDGVIFRLRCEAEGGRSAAQGLGSFRVEAQSGSLENYTLQAIMRNQSLPHCNLAVRIVREDGPLYRYSARMQCAKGATLASLALSGELPRKLFAGRELLIDGKSLRLPEDFTGQGRLYRGGAGEVVIPMLERKVVLRGGLELEVAVQEETARINLYFSPAHGVVKEAALTVEILDLPYRPAIPVDLRSAANMGLLDETAEDRRGGWTDQGPENDLRMLLAGRRDFGGVAFDIADGGKSAIVLAGPNRNYFPQAAVVKSVPAARGKFLYLLHALAWAPQNGDVGEIKLTYSDGVAAVLPVRAGREAGNWHKPVSLDNGAVVWIGENGDNYIGLYRSCFKIDDKPLASMEFRSNGRAVWGIVAASLAEDEVPVRKSTPYYVRPGKEWCALVNHKDILPGSALDFSHRLDAPAGKYGPVIMREGRTVFRDRPEVPARFYGCNLNFTVQYLEKAQAEQLADRLAAAGYNAVRIHHHDNGLRNPAGDETGLNTDNLDRLEYLIACLKKRGLYITSDLYVSRKFTGAEFAGLPAGTGSNVNFKALIFAFPPAMENWKNFARNWLSHVNPYTGLALKDDPALISLSLVNEGNLGSTWSREPAASLFRNAFEAWKPKAMPASLGKADHDTRFAAFLVETYAGKYAEMRDYLRSLGVNAILTDQNMHVQLLHSIMRDRYDYVDNHRYWDHPSFPETAWRLPSGHHNRSALESLAYPAQILPSRLFGKPFFLTEFDFARPNRYRAEGAVITGAYAALQDWNALFHFAYAHGKEVAFQDDYVFSQSGHFDSVVDPVKALSQRIGLALFLDGELLPSPLAYAVLLTDEPSLTFTRGYPQSFGRLGLIARVGSVVMPGGVFDPGRVPPGITGFIDAGVNFPRGVKGTPVYRDAAEVLKNCAPEEGVFRSPGGSITADTKRRTFRVVTPGCEALIVPAGKTLAGDFLTVENREGRGVFSAIALDGRPLAGSERVLLLHLTDTLATMTRFSDERRTLLQSWGKFPLLAERGEAVVTLAGEGQYTLYALDLSGKRLNEVSLTKKRFKMEVFGEKDAVLVYELVKKNDSP